MPHHAQEGQDQGDHPAASVSVPDVTETAHGTRGPTVMVTITVNGAPFSIHRGRQSVATIKTIAGVPLADQLTEVANGHLVPLADEGAVTLKGEEVFVSHPKDSGSSSTDERALDGLEDCDDYP